MDIAYRQLQTQFEIHGLLLASLVLAPSSDRRSAQEKTIRNEPKSQLRPLHSYRQPYTGSHQ